MDEREMLRLAQDAPRVRALSQYLLEYRNEYLSEDAKNFLGRLTRYTGEPLLSIRQREFLYNLVETSSLSQKAGSYRASTLIERLLNQLRMLDEGARGWIDDDTMQWIGQLASRGTALALTRSQWRKILAICKIPDIGIIPEDEYVQINGSRLMQ